VIILLIKTRKLRWVKYVTRIADTEIHTFWVGKTKGKRSP